MKGRKLYEHALTIVPAVIKECMEKAGLGINEINKLLIHQANNKMDEAILKNLYSLYGRKDIPEYIMPMTISWLGNSSVATIPTLYDLLLKKQIQGQSVGKGNVIVFAAVGEGINVNAVIYKMPENMGC